MSPTDLPPVPSEHAGTIIGSNWPEHSEAGNVAAAIDLFRRAAESVGTGDTAETMQALIEANATGHTPTELVADFSDEQRKAFDRAVSQLNQGHGASVMAQDILNTKVALNGTVVEFEAAVQELLAAAAAAPQTPKTQAEFERRYNELLDAAKQQADKLGSNHRQTQEALVAGLQSGATPDVPSTMTPTPAGGSLVPGMPDGALGGLLQNVAGQMMKPQNLPFPNLSQLGQSMAPIAQSAQAAIGQLMSSLGGVGAGGGVPVSDDALAALTAASGVGTQDSTLSSPAAPVGTPAAGATAGGLGGGGRPAVAGSASDQESRTTLAAEAPDQAPSLSASGPDNPQVPLASTATAPPSPAVTAAPLTSVPTTTLSSADTGLVADTMGAARTHTSGGDAASSAAVLAQPAAGTQPTVVGGGAAGMPMMPMMPMGAAPGGGGGGGGHASGTHVSAGSAGGAVTTYNPDRPAPPAELTDFGSDLKGLEHATDTQLVAASVLAALVRMHDRMGVSTEVAVGVSPTGAVFATSDGLGFLPVGTRAAAHLVPLITLVPEEFTARWLGCAQPWRPLIEAAAVGLAGPFEAVVTTDSAAEAVGVLSLGPEEIEAVNIAAGSADRWHFDAIDAEDVDPALNYLLSVWGRPAQSALDLEAAARRAHWSGESPSSRYPRLWAQYLLAAAMADIAAGDIGDARYALRSALRVPEPKELP